MLHFGKKKKKVGTSNSLLINDFDKQAYLDANPDVVDGIESGQFKDALHHLKLFGFSEIKLGRRKFHRNFSEFDEEQYMDLNRDIKVLVEQSKLSSAYEHFCTKGYAEIINGKRDWKSPETDQEESGVDDETELCYFKENDKSNTLPKVKKELLNTEFYASYYDDMHTVKSNDEIAKHWKEFGISEKRYPNIVQLCNAIGFKYDLSILNINTIVKLNPLLSTLNKSEILIKVIQVKKIDLIRISKENDFDADFYLKLGESYLLRGERVIAHQILLYAFYLNPTSKCSEYLGNYYLDNGQKKQALTFYMDTLIRENDYESLWLYININKIYRSFDDMPSALKIIVLGLKKFQENSHLLKILDETINDAWDSEQENLNALSKRNAREELIKSVDDQVSKLSLAYKEVFTQVSEVPTPVLNTKNILIIGDFHVPQCIRYRIDQKVEQLTLAGYEVTKVSWTDLHQKYEEIFFNDIIIYYRVPAMPIVIKSIEKAKSLGKVTFFEIDDLLFDTVYPPAYETYGGNISIEEYAGLLYGMPLFRATAKLCEYAIGSTLPLVDLLEPLVISNKSYLHRNGLDSLNVFMNKKEKSYVNIFYGSGTLAHNSDFLDLTLEALERILEENNDVKLTIVGHLNLPDKFIKQFKDQVVILEKTSTIEHYWSYLSGADINLAVLENDVINDCKSELKWFEAACFKIPSIVSNTQNYIDVIEEGRDALIAGTPQEWYEALNKLVKNKQLRDEMGNNAYEKVIVNYSLEALSLNIDSIIQTVLDERLINE